MSTASKIISDPRTDAALVSGDPELSKILGEVEALQREIADARTDSALALQEPAGDYVSDLGAPSAEGSLEDTLGGLEVEESTGGMLSESSEETVGEVPSAQAFSRREPAVAGGLRPVPAEILQATGEGEDPHVAEALKTINDEIGRLTGDQAASGPQASGGGGASSSGGEAQDGSLKLTLKGQMSLQLEFESAGQGVFVATEDGKLIVRLTNGAEFRIPLDATPSRLRRVV